MRVLEWGAQCAERGRNQEDESIFHLGRIISHILFYSMCGWWMTLLSVDELQKYKSTLYVFYLTL